jgi:hypothetical protein
MRIRRFRRQGKVPVLVELWRTSRKWGRAWLRSRTRWCWKRRCWEHSWWTRSCIERWMRRWMRRWIGGRIGRWIRRWMQRWIRRWKRRWIIRRGSRKARWNCGLCGRRSNWCHGRQKDSCLGNEESTTYRKRVKSCPAPVQHFIIALRSQIDCHLTFEKVTAKLIEHLNKVTVSQLKTHDCALNLKCIDIRAKLRRVKLL